MKTYDVSKDIKRIRAFFDLNQKLFADAVSISRLSILRYENEQTYPTDAILENIYSYAYRNGLNLNDAKASLYMDDSSGKKLLFHGARGKIDSEIDIHHSIPPNDFGDGFYAGETLEQAATWISGENKSSVYCFYFNKKSELRGVSFAADRRWLYAILYYRGALINKHIPNEIMKIVKEVEEADYLIAPIADNQMYQIINMFIDNLITDEACLHALATTNLGKQYVFKTMKACKELECVDRLYLCNQEKRDYESIKSNLAKKSNDKANIAITEYRRKGKYFDELF